MLNSIVLQAPAKINYRLDVLSRRPDGYHELRMIMQRVNLCDEISIALSDLPGIRVRCGKSGVPDGEGNIAWKAAKKLYDLAEYSAGIDIDITKNIPVAAGLGGGSSDCAAVLTGVNELLGLSISKELLMETAVKLGADVPFFLFDSTALAEGIGEILSPVTRVPDAWIVLVNPNVHVSTAWVYKNLQLTRQCMLDTLPNSFETVSELATILHNDLESVTITEFPVINEIKLSLMELGATGAMMSGSGPTVFGIFDDESRARKAATSIGEKNPEWFSVAVETV